MQKPSFLRVFLLIIIENGQKMSFFDEVANLILLFLTSVFYKTVNN